MKNGLAFIFMAMFLILSSGCDKTESGQLPEKSPVPEYKTDTKDSEGVVEFCEYNRDSSQGWLENTNEYPVRIEEIMYIQGESLTQKTVRMYRLEPHERHEKHCFSNSLYIYDMNGVKIGYID